MNRLHPEGIWRPQNLPQVQEIEHGANPDGRVKHMSIDYFEDFHSESLLKFLKDSNTSLSREHSRP